MRTLFFTAYFILFFLLVATATGQKRWDNEGHDSLWTTATNWNPDGLPGLTDELILDNTFVSGSYSVYDTSNTAQTVRSCQIGYAGNTNTILLIVGGSVVNILTVNGGGSAALHVTDGGILRNQSRNGTRGIKLGSTTDVFKMSGTGRYIHATLSSSSKIPQLTSGTTTSNYDFSPSSIFELQTSTFDTIPPYGSYLYNVPLPANSVGKCIAINGDLQVHQGTLGVGASATSTFTVRGSVVIDTLATFRGNSASTAGPVSTIDIAGNVSGAGTLQGSSSSNGTTRITVGGDVATLIAFGTGTTDVTFSGGTPAVTFAPANGTTPSIKNFKIGAGKTVTFSPPNNINLSVGSGDTVIVDGVLNLETHTLSGPGNLTVSGMLGLGNASGLNGNVVLSGTKTYDGATFVYSGAVHQITGSSLPAVIAGLVVRNDSGITLSKSTAVRNTLRLSSGKLTIGTNALTIDSACTLSEYSSSSYVLTDSSGAFVRNSVAASPALFPVGTLSSYAPVTITNSGTADTFSVSVKSSFSHPPNSTACVNLQWEITENTPSASNASLTFQWNSADESGTTFSHNNQVFVGRWNGTQWVQTPATSSGSGPYTATANGFTQFSEFGIGNEGALPIQVASFSAALVDPHKIRLEWTTISETNCLGFFVERRLEAISTFTRISDLIPGAGTSLGSHSYSWTDTTADDGVYYYRLREMDLDSDVSFSNEIVVMVTGVPEKEEITPKAFSLQQNYPNPFNTETVIRYQLPVSSFVTLRVYGTLGEEVRVLVNEVQVPGLRSVNFNAGTLPSGIYFYELTAIDGEEKSDRRNSHSSVKSMLLIK